ncbi:hypothetical protein [Winogradskyella ouciana]|uniref:hypothetical protein n=1 Tax=Winogradskyella ouciana TaxID=2608631 RepID=UPI003D2DD604
MNDKKNIDRLFQEKFKDFEVAPNDAVWNRISESLPNKKRKRRVVALWWQIGGVAAAIALLLTIGISVFNSDIDNSVDPTVVDTEDLNNNSNQNNNNSTSNDKQNELKDDEAYEKLEFVGSEKDDESINGLKEDNGSDKKSASKNLTSNPKSQLNSVAVYSDNKDKGENPPSQEREKLTTIIDADNTKVASVDTKSSENSNKTELANDKDIKSAIKKTIEDNNTAVTDNSTSKGSEKSNSENTDATSATEDIEKKDILKEDPKKESILDAIAANNAEDKDTDEKEKEDEQNRWSITPNVAPVYYSSLGEGSPIDGQFNDNSKSSDINMSYGITTAYAVNERLKVRTGVNVVNLSQSTSDVFAITNPNPAVSASFVTSGSGANVTQKYANVTLNNQAQSVSLMSAKAMVSSLDLSTKVGSIDQRFGFIEVPLELEYRVLDKKFGVNVIGGFSTFFLNENEIYADLDGVNTLIGEANNINSTSFSANFGLGLDYSLSKQWNINLEPQFKYQINTFNNTSGNYRPFFIGVYTGLSFKF